MRFPLADWIDDHADCRHQLGSSGMGSEVSHPLPTRAEIRAAAEEDLRAELGSHLGVDPRRIFLTVGATEANTAVLFYLGGARRTGSRLCRVDYPEYPSLVDTAACAGLTVSPGARGARVALISQPRNPGGDLWTSDRLEEWAGGARDLVVDETFREFAGRPSIAARGERGRWATGSFTKFFGADDLRVGYVIAPEDGRERFARFHGLLFDELAKYSVAGALACLRELPRIRRDVAAILAPNVRRLRAAFSVPAGPRGPTSFVRVAGFDGNFVAEQALRASVLVCPGRFFGDPSGVRICLTRRSFPRDLAAFLRVRDSLAAPGPRGTLSRARGR